MLLNETDTKNNNKVNDIDSLWCTIFDHIRLCMHSCTATYFFRFHDWNRCVQCWRPLVVHVIELSTIWQTPITVGECGYSTKRSSDDHTPRPFNGGNSVVTKVQTCQCVGCIFSARQQLWPDASPDAANGWRLTQVHLEKVRCLKPLGAMSAPSYNHMFSHINVLPLISLAQYQRTGFRNVPLWRDCAEVNHMYKTDSCINRKHQERGKKNKHSTVLSVPQWCYACRLLVRRYRNETIIMPPLLGINGWFCLMSVCLTSVGTSGLIQEQRGLGRIKLAQRYPMSYVTWTPLSRSKGHRSPGRFG